MAWSFPEGGVLGIFAKRPEPGRAKTRLSAALGNEPAVRVAEAMLFDTLDLWGSDAVMAPGGRRVVVYDPPDAGPWFDPRTPESFALQPQIQGDLGVRMASFFAGEFEEGASKVVIVGADSPTLDPAFVVSTFLLLEQKDVVIGPATDGGFYLLGLKRPTPELFEGVRWSTSSTLREVVGRIETTGLSLGLLPPWYDVDTLESWEMLVGHVQAMRRAGTQMALPRLSALIDRMHPPRDPRGFARHV